jgi:hypothetical protein
VKTAVAESGARVSNGSKTFLNLDHVMDYVTKQIVGESKDKKVQPAAKHATRCLACAFHAIDAHIKENIK